MVSRRILLQAGGAALAGGGLGLVSPQQAGAAGARAGADAGKSGAAARLLPSFGRPVRLDVADVGSLDGHD
ncbi:hypothetical protein, partial [Streptomyces sp. NPDC059900]